MTAENQIQELLVDLGTINDIARASVRSWSEKRLEPGEIRPAAVLLLDMVGFTPLTRKIGSEMISLLIDRTFRIFELTVKAYGGYQAGFTGDGALYLFAGHPNYPPVCEAALRAALRLRERTQQVNGSLAETGLAVDFRIGVSFGEVILQQEKNSLGQPVIIGNAVNLAARLESTSSAGQIQTIRAVLDTAGDIFVVSELGVKALKGYGELATYGVHGIDEPVAQLRGAYRELTPLVGRDAMLSQAEAQIESWLQTKYGPESWDIAEEISPLPQRNRLMLLSGVAAAGKSRLAYELVERMRRQHGVCTASGHCSEGASLSDFTAELVTVAGLERDNLVERWEELCRHAAQTLGEDYATRQRRHLQLLAFVLKCDAVDTSGIRQAEAASFETACCLAVRACVELIAHYTGKPVVIFIDDLQWQSSVAAIINDLLTNTRLPWPLIVIAAARPEYLGSVNPEAEGVSAQYEVGTLSRGDSARLLSLLLPGLQLPDELSLELHNKAAGLPYFYEEFARMLKNGGFVRETDGRYSLARDVSDMEIPRDLHSMFLGRIDQLEPAQKAVLSTASILGATFERRILEAVISQCQPEIAPEVDRQLTLLIDLDLFQEDALGKLTFKHILLQEAAYAAVLSANKRLLHASAAAAIDQFTVRGGAEEYALARAKLNHLLRSNQLADALRLAADILVLQAISGRNDGWDELLQLSGDLSTDPQIPEDTRLAGRSVVERALGVRLLRQGKREEAKTKFERAIDLATRANYDVAAMHAYCNLAICLREAGDYPTASAYYDRATLMAKQLKQHGFLAYIYGNKGLLHYRQGHIRRALKYYRQAQEISRQSENLSSETQALIYEGTLHLDQGEAELAQEVFKRVLLLSRTTGERNHESMALNNLGAALQALGRLDEATEYLEESLRLDRLIGWRGGEPFSLFNLAEIAAERGDYGKAGNLFRDTMELARELNRPKLSALAMVYVAKAQAFAKELSGAKQTLSEAKPIITELHSTQLSGLLECMWAYYHFWSNNLMEAQQRRQRAEELLDPGDNPFGAQLSIEYNKLVSILGDAKEARLKST